MLDPALHVIHLRLHSLVDLRDGVSIAVFLIPIHFVQCLFY